MLKEFKDFALKGNVIDLAIGVIIGGAFSKIVTSFVQDIIMPIISLITGRVDFTNLFISLNGVKYKTIEEAKKAGAATLNYGAFITTVIDFAIVAFCLFIFMKQINRFKKKDKEDVQKTKTCPYCMSSIHINAVKCPYCASEVE